MVTDEGIFERRRALKRHEREVLRQSQVVRREDVFDEVLLSLQNQDIPGFETLLKRRLQTLQQVFERAAERNPDTVRNFFEQYLIQAINPEAEAETLTTLSYADDEELDEILLDRPGVEAGSEAYKEARRQYVVHETAEVIAMNFVWKSGTTFQDEAFLTRLPDMVRAYRAWLEKKREEILRQSDLARERFRSDIQELIRRRILPLRREEVEECLSTVRVDIIDPLVGVTRERWGHYQGKTHTVSFDPRIPQPLFYTVYAHEVFHALSGRTEWLSYHYFTEESREVNPDLALFEVPRLGFAAQKRVKGRAEAEYTWLNEAVTELCTQLVSKEAYAYKDECALVRVLMKFGLSWKTLTKAYFADEDLRTNSVQATPHIRELFLEAERIFGKRLLADLNVLIENEPTKKHKKAVLQRLVKYGESDKLTFIETVLKEAQELRETRKDVWRHEAEMRWMRDLVEIGGGEE